MYSSHVCSFSPTKSCANSSIRSFIHSDKMKFSVNSAVLKSSLSLLRWTHSHHAVRRSRAIGVTKKTTCRLVHHNGEEWSFFAGSERGKPRDEKKWKTVRWKPSQNEDGKMNWQFLMASCFFRESNFGDILEFISRVCFFSPAFPWQSTNRMLDV